MYFNTYSDITYTAINKKHTSKARRLIWWECKLQEAVNAENEKRELIYSEKCLEIENELPKREAQAVARYLKAVRGY